MVKLAWRSTCTILLLLIATTGFGANLKWSDNKYSLYARQDKLRDVLAGLATSEGIPIEVSDSVQDVISANFENMPRQQIFKQLVEAYGLSWYYDGHRLYIDLLENAQTSTIKLNAISVAAFKKHLQDLGVIDNDSRYGWQEIEQKRLIYISGPAPFIERVNEMAKALDDRYSNVATVYKWVDADGITHFSSNSFEAPSQANIIELETDSITILPSSTISSDAADSPAPAGQKSVDAATVLQAATIQ